MTRTPEERAERERAAAALVMENLRLRGVVGVKDDAPEPDPFAEALEEACAPAPRAYPTQEELDVWAANPGAMTDQQHSDYCVGGTLVQAGQGASTPCARCKAKDEEANLRARLIAAGVDGRYLDSSWDDLDQPAPLDRLARACGHIRAILKAGQSLLLWSEDTGTGKTQAAMLAAAAAVRAGRTAHVANLARLAVEIRDGYNARDGEERLREGTALARLCAPDLLVLDDLGAGESDSASVERRLLFLALDHRQMHKKSTIVTTNLPPAALVALMGARVTARLQPLVVIHVNHGTNFRLPRDFKSLW